MRYSSCWAALVYDNGGVWQFQTWLDGDQWEQFAIGALWKNPVNFYKVVGCDMSANCLKAGSEDKQALSDIENCMIYRPNGTSTVAQDSTLEIAEGAYSGTPVYTNEQNWMRIRVLAFTGKARERMKKRDPITNEWVWED